MGLEEHRLAPDAHRHSHAFKPSCINRLASMPTDVWAKYACRFNSGWCGNGDEKPFAGTSVQVCEDDPSRRRADDAHGETIAVPLISAYSVIKIPALVFDFRVAFTGSSSSGLDEWGSIIDACLAGDWPVCCLRSREPFTPLVARCGICLKRFRYEFANKPSLDSGLLKSDCFGTDGRASLILISFPFLQLDAGILVRPETVRTPSLLLYCCGRTRRTVRFS